MEHITSDEASQLSNEGNSQFLWPAAYTPTNASQYAIGCLQFAIHQNLRNIFCGAVACLSSTNINQLEISSDISVRTMKIPTQYHIANQFPHSFSHIQNYIKFYWPVLGFIPSPPQTTK